MPEAFRLPATCRQVLLCLAPDWQAQSGHVFLCQRQPGAQVWQSVGAALPAMLGRAGLAWGRGLHPVPGAAAPGKREGDGRAPAGVFALTALFGDPAAASELEAAVRLPWLTASAARKCIDDPGSAHYNRIVDQSAVVPPDWTSCEDMLRADGRYAIGAVVAHNPEPAVPGLGSCIFLHVWAAPGVATAGCTALALADMRTIAGWLDGAAQPLLVQLPQAEYERLRADWGLPEVAAAR